MKRRIGTQNALILTLALATSTGLGVGLGMVPGSLVARAATPGRAIMEKVAQARKLAGSEAVVEMRIINAKGQARIRKLSMATKLFDGGKTEKRIYRFLSPPDVEGTGVLVFDYEDKADDVWIFLPALRKTRRVVSAQRSKKFMGSEFSYGDLNIPELDDFEYSTVREESAGGEPCWVIDAKPKTQKTANAEGYSRKTYWVSKVTHAVRKGLYYDLDGELLKELQTRDIELLDRKNGRYRSKFMEMTNKQNGRKSEFKTEKVTFAPDTKDDYFTTRFLERT